MLADSNQRGHRGRPPAGPDHRIALLDPLVAAVVALNLIWTGYGLIRQAAAGLLDEEDPGSSIAC